MPNPIAFLALAIWPIVIVALFGRLRADRALIWGLMLGYLFLPESPAVFDLPLMPPLNKHNIPALAAFMVTLWKFGDQGGSYLPQSLAGRVLLATFILSPALTVLNNEEPVFYGQVGLPGLTIKDAVALVLGQFLLVLPFLLARKHLASGGAQREILFALMVGGLVYSLLMLIEMRLSPQLNLWVYGYYQHLFGQSIRGGGYRPVVFLYHGLWTAFFAMTALVSAWALWRERLDDGRFKLLLAGLYLGAIVVLSNSLGALLFAVLLVPMVIFLGTRMQVRIAMVIGLLALAYPVLKGADLVPEQRLLNQAASIDPQRAASLEFRFDNENTLLERAYLKPVFGWGSWGRNHILDPVSGNILTVTDGRWIIVIGVYGWVGFVAEFGLLILPLLLIGREVMASERGRVSPLVGPLCLMLAINVTDMIPNATLTPLTWLIVGALTGYAEKLRAERLRLRSARLEGLQWKSIM
ncbi:hypothetical protein [Pseudoponticoccus marisrubri]|uniref:O-antigen polymerase n=1 Tax=Pseudoponticoccus marisrubri TaxID=1685382 RepID=A0A0W7WHU7_9RHOB|nr:hypothetical protein [Pseudoponticoccus marisrubri]KUF10161.1 hypothetical protein AVJ23_14015 [Pseudoponticoccus marisrubri]